MSLHTWEHHSAVKRGEALTLATTWMDPENMMLSEGSQTQKDTQGVIPLMGNVQNREIRRHREWVPGCQGLGEGMGVTADGDRASLFGGWSVLKLTVWDIENRLVVAKGEGYGGGMDWKFGISRCKLLYMGWINNKILLYSTGNYIQYPVTNHNGKEYEKEYIYVYESFGVQQKLTTL